MTAGALAPGSPVRAGAAQTSVGTYQEAPMQSHSVRVTSPAYWEQRWVGLA
jgi:hypothetical protein